jgi:threonine dehydratase
LTLSIIIEHVSDIFIVTEEEIITAMRRVWERMKIIIEPSSAVPVGAVLNQKNGLTGKKVGVILTGGNVDLEKLRWS